MQLIFRLSPLTSAEKSNEKSVDQKLCNTVLILDALYSRILSFLLIKPKYYPQKMASLCKEIIQHWKKRMVKLFWEKFERKQRIPILGPYVVNVISTIFNLIIFSVINAVHNSAHAHRDHSSITSAKRWVGGVRKWQFLLIYSTVYADVGGWA